MPTVSRKSASKVVDYGPAEDRTEVFGEYTINFTSVREYSDLGPAQRASRRQLSLPALGLRVHRQDHGVLRRPRRGYRGWRGVLHAARPVPAVDAGSEFLMSVPARSFGFPRRPLPGTWRRCNGPEAAG